MKIDYPTQDQTNALRQLWQEAFGDEDAFLDLFYAQGFSPDRCRCVTVDGQLAGALYWFDCNFQGRPVAYLYGIATAKAFRGQGICRTLMENTQNHLKYLGYEGIVLVPAEDGLFRMYEKMGYAVCSSVSEFTCYPEEAVALHPIDASEYCRLRREFLPEGGILQEGDGIAFLSGMADFYAGEDFLVAVNRDHKFFAPELLGNTQAASGILAALGKKEGRFRCPGTERSFAMFQNLSDMPIPSYFGLAFD